MKKTIGELIHSLEKKNGKLAGGFGGIRGGVKNMMVYVNFSGLCSNTGTCQSTNKTCDNSGTCTDTTNGTCTNATACFM